MLKALDLFCCGGGASMGLHRAGLDVTGVDIEPRPSYPFRFIQADALTFDLRGFDLIWASPPCQRFCRLTGLRGSAEEHPDLVDITRRRVLASGTPYILENVPGAPLRADALLCGSMFGLAVRRHRIFECSFSVLVPSCNHSRRAVGVYGNTGGSSKRDGVSFGSLADWRAAMGIDWLGTAELSQAIPPAYSEFLARAFLASQSRVAA